MLALHLLLNSADITPLVRNYQLLSVSLDDSGIIYWAGHYLANGHNSLIWLLGVKQIPKGNQQDGRISPSNLICKSSTDQEQSISIRTDNGSLMIQCEKSEIWFHGKCVDITAKVSERLDSFYFTKCIAPRFSAASSGGNTPARGFVTRRSSRLRRWCV